MAAGEFLCHPDDELLLLRGQPSGDIDEALHAVPFLDVARLEDHSTGAGQLIILVPWHQRDIRQPDEIRQAYAEGL